MTLEQWGVLVVVVPVTLVRLGLGVWEFVLNWRLSHGRCLCGKRMPCRGGCR